MHTKNSWRFYPVRRRSTVSGARQRGMTLVEWMVSITIGMVLLAGLTGLIVRQSSTQAELEKSSRQIENGRYAMQILNDDIQLAGYYGEFGADVSISPVSSLPGAPLPCEKDIVGPGASPNIFSHFAVEGFNAPIGNLPCGINVANYIPGTDILIVRRADAGDNPNGVAVGDIKANQLYIQTGVKNGSLGYAIAMASANETKPETFDLVQKDGKTAGKIRKYLVRVYYLSPCSTMKNESTCTASDDGGTPIPTLRYIEPSSPNASSVPLVEGIENLQIDYGIDTDGDGAPDGDFVTAPADPKDWANVMALRIHLLARNNERSAGYTDTKNYNLGLAGSTTATNDGFKRRVFSQHTRLVNPSSRRDR